MDLSYFHKINNTYKSSSKQETELYLINRNEERWLYDNADAHKVLRNGNPYELLIIKGTSDVYKKIKAKNSMPFNLGDYIQYKDRIYLVTSLDPNDKCHHSGTMTICMFILRWQRYDGTIIERWACPQDFTKYDNGQISNGTLTIGSNQYGMIIPLDDETKMLRRDMRFIIDVIDEEDVLKGAVPDTYLLSNKKNVLSDYSYFNRGAISTITLRFDFFDRTKDKYVECPSGMGWICDYKEKESIKYSDYTILIDGSDTINYDYKHSWNLVFKDKDDNIISQDKIKDDWSWDTESLPEYVEILFENKEKITLLVSKEEYIGEDFSLRIIIGGTVISEKRIFVTGI